jgi:hypothetical protein
MSFRTYLTVFAAAFALSTQSANAENYFALPTASTGTWLKPHVLSGGAIEARARPGPVWSGLLTFTTVSDQCRPAASSFVAGEKHMAFVRPFPSGSIGPAFSVVFPDGSFLGVPRTTTQYGAIAIATQTAWLYASPTNTNSFSFKTVPATVSKSTPQFTLNATLNYFHAIAGCRVTLQGVLKK